MIGRTFFWVSCLTILFSCGNTEIKLDGVDLETWVRDTGGCDGLRAAAADTLERQRDKLLRRNEMEITRLLGKPDENELYVRGQKFYRYYLDPCPVCANAADNARSLVIRFNAVGLSSEAYVE